MVIYRGGLVGSVGPTGTSGVMGEVFHKYALVTFLSDNDPDFGYVRGKKYKLSQLSSRVDDGYYITDNIMKPILITKVDYDNNFGNLEDLRDLTIDKIIND